MSERYYTTPSSLGSYFGVGFNNPEDQLKIDLGLLEPDFDDDAQDRMLLGRVLEDAMLNYFEQKMDIKITDRNTDTFFFYDGKIKGVVDGMTVINGLLTVVENKISNAYYGPFTENMGYLLQCQAYMLGKNASQCLLCGQYQGRPIYKLIQRDEAIIKDIKEMTDFIVSVLMGLDDFSNYPMHILEKYSTTKILPEISTMSDDDLHNIRLLSTYKEQVKTLEKKIKDIEEPLKNKYSEGVFDNGSIRFTIATQERKGGYDIDRLSIEHPEIDYNKYLKPATTLKVMRLKIK